MKILVVGGAGYIGSHVVLDLMEAGHKVVVFDNMSTGRQVNLFPGNAFFHGDLLKAGDIERALEEHGPFDGAIHLAAKKAAGESMVKPELYSSWNITGSLNLLNGLSSAGVRKLVFSSSAAVYGNPEYLPMDDNHPTEPENYYGFTKLEIERFLAWYDQLKGVKFAALRYFNAAGYDPQNRVRGLEQNPANLLPIILEAAAGLRPELQVFGNDYPTSDGSCIRDYIHVSDLARAHTLALEKLGEGADSMTVNLGTGNGISVLEMLEKARSITGKAIPSQIVGRREGDPAASYAKSNRAKELLGWEPVHSDVNTLISSTWEMYKREYGL